MQTNKKSHPAILISFFCAALLVCLFSCNDNKKEEKEKVSTEKVETNSAALAAGPFAVLQLSKQNLVNVFSPGGTKKIVILFRDENTAGNKIDAVIFGARPNGVQTNGPILLASMPVASWDTSGVKILGNNELSEKKVRSLINVPAGPITLANAKDLYFYPKKDGNNYVFYIVSVTPPGQEMLYYPPGLPSNPCPPAPPCDPCD